MVGMTDRMDEFRHVFAEHDLGLSDALVVLGSHFQLASQTGDEPVVRYSQGGRPAISLSFTSKGRVGAIEPGPGLRDDDLERLLAAFRALRPRHVMAVVIFATVPTVGRWRYRDRFQLFPMPSGAPRPPLGFGGVHPLMLEVAYDGSEHDRVDEHRGAAATREINRLLSAVLRGAEDRLGHFVRLDWVVVPSTGDDGTEQLQSYFGRIGYFLEGEAAMRRAGFTVVPDAMPELELEDKDVYYACRATASSDVFVLPATFDATVDGYLGLPRTQQDQALRWCHWLNHARQVAAMSPSAAAIAAVQSIEALLPAGEPTGRCSSCGRSIGLSISDRFRHFVEEFAPGDANAAGRTQVYGLRSKLTHGGALMIGELRQIAFGDFVPRSWNEREIAEQALMLSRLAGVNWLLRSSIAS
jgi:hypothetical protein